MSIIHTPTQRTSVSENGCIATHTTRECVNELLHILNDNFTFANVASNINVIEEEERQHIPEKFVPYHPLHDIPEMADTTIYVASILHEMQSALFKREVNTSPSLEHDESGERVYSHPWTGTFWETRSQKLETEHPNALPLYFSIFGDATTVTNFKSLSVHPFTFSLMGDDIRMRQSAAGNPVLVYASELKSMLCQHMCAATDYHIGPASISVEDFRGVHQLYIQRICLRLLAEVITVQQRGGIGMYCYDAETGDIQYKKVFPVLQNLTVDGGERKYLLGIYPQQSGVKQACYICDCPGHALNNIERFPLRLDIMDEVLIEELVTEYQAGNLEWVKQSGGSIPCMPYGYGASIGNVGSDAIYRLYLCCSGHGTLVSVLPMTSCIATLLVILRNCWSGSTHICAVGLMVWRS